MISTEEETFKNQQTVDDRGPALCFTTIDLVSRTDRVRGDSELNFVEAGLQTSAESGGGAKAKKTVYRCVSLRSPWLSQESRPSGFSLQIRFYG